MTYRKCLALSSLVLAVALLGGCAKAARDTAGFAIENTITIEQPYEDAWQLVKRVLRDQEFEIYTRDKRGTFVAYSQMKRRFFQPTRTQYTVELAQKSSDETLVYVETIKQVYGVTTFTYPDWHDRKTKDESGTLALLDAIQARASGDDAPPEEPSLES